MSRFQHPLSWFRALVPIILMTGCGPETVVKPQGFCRDLDVNEIRIVSSTSTPVEAHYRLTRSNNENGHRVYRVGLNLDFVPAQDANPEDALEMRRQTEACYSEARAHLKASDGTRIELELLAGGKGSKLPRRVEVKVSKQVERPTHLHWGLSQGCAATIHESFHHLGLVDEYQEPAHSGPSFDCRKVGPRGSIMRDGLSDAELFGMHQQISCNCNESSDDYSACVEALGSLSGIPSECPAPSVASIDWVSIGVQRADLKRQMPLSRFEWDRLENGGPESPKKYVFLRQAAFVADAPPALLPAHVRSIVYPGCEAKNAIYYDCAAEAYRSTDGDQESCEKDVQPACAGGNLDWLLN